MSRRIRRASSILTAACILLLMLSCSSGGDGDGDDGGGAPDTTAPTVSSVSPADGAQDIARDAALQVTFSEAMDAATITTGAFTLSSQLTKVQITGTVSGSDRTYTFTPDDPLDHNLTFVGRIAATVTDAAGNPLAAAHEWSFTTEAAPAAPVDIPLDVGNAWLYEAESTTTVWSASGSSTSTFAGNKIIWIEALADHAGRSGVLARRFSLDTSVTTESALNSSKFYLAGDVDGLYRADTDGTWENVLRFLEVAYDNSAFLLTGGPAHADGTTASIQDVTVPAGTFSTLAIEHDYSETGHWAPEDIFETRREYYADGVGLVAAAWNYSFDDNDPSGIDITDVGHADLAEAMNGPSLPLMVAEAEPNDGYGAGDPQAWSENGIVTGSIHISDTGPILVDADVNCDQGCIIENIDGVGKIQDWYVLTVTENRPLRLDLVFTGYGSDLDMYIFQEWEGDIYFGAYAADEAGQPEWIYLYDVPPGQYWVAVQAYDTPEGVVDYTLSMSEAPSRSAGAGVKGGGRIIYQSGSVR